MRLFTLVLGFFHCFQKFFPVFSQPGQCLFHRHPINSRRSLVGFDPLAGSVQVLPAQDPFKQIRTALFLSFLTANTLRSRIPFVFRTISLWAARLFAVFPFIMLTSFCNLLGTNDCSVIPSFFPVLWPLLTSCGSLLLRIFPQCVRKTSPGTHTFFSSLPAAFTEKRFRVAIGRGLRPIEQSTHPSWNFSPSRGDHGRLFQPSNSCLNSHFAKKEKTSNFL